MGFDFPIGVPRAFAELAGVSRFPAFLGSLAETAPWWSPAATAEEISLARPFYPRAPGHRGSHRRVALVRALRLDWAELHRHCERALDGRRAACPLFWTLGGQQVGKAALAGWAEVLRPALGDPALDVGLWPFDGPLPALLESRAVVVAETYPADAYVAIGIDLRRRSKRRQRDRRANAAVFLAWAETRGAHLDDALAQAARTGFSGRTGEDDFDTVAGLLAMLDVVDGRLPAGEPEEDFLRGVEGWILGRPQAAA